MNCAKFTTAFYKHKINEVAFIKAFCLYWLVKKCALQSVLTILTVMLASYKNPFLAKIFSQ